MPTHQHAPHWPWNSPGGRERRSPAPPGTVSAPLLLSSGPPPAREAARAPQRRRARQPLWFTGVACGLLLCCSPGCFQDQHRQTLLELEQCRAALQQQRDELAAQKATIDELHRRLNTATRLKPDELAQVFHPVRIEIEALSGGFDNDGQPGDDGVVVYLRPIDQEGDPIKAAGEIRIQLYDLEAPAAENLIAEYLVPVEEARRCWYGKLLTYHYAIRVPWPGRPPRNPEITIRATFVDYLSQRVMSAQRTCKVKLP